MLKIDLHCHSTASDGLLSPGALIDRALVNELRLLAITDHDTLAGFHQAKAQALASGLHLISGVEFSTQWSGVGIHLVALAVEVEHPALLRVLDAQGQAREQRAREIGCRLDKLGMVESYAAARRLAGDSQLGRPHFAELMVRQGKARDTASAFKKFLGAGKAGDVKNQWLPLDELIAVINTAGGVPVLAHPAKYKLSATKLRRLLVEFKEMGGRGMEVISGPQSRDLVAHYAKLSRDFGFYASCGSDFHGPVSPWRDLGLIAPLPKDCMPITDLLGFPGD